MCRLLHRSKVIRFLIRGKVSSIRVGSACNAAAIHVGLIAFAYCHALRYEDISPGGLKSASILVSGKLMYGADVATSSFRHSVQSKTQVAQHETKAFVTRRMAVGAALPVQKPTTVAIPESTFVA